MSFTTPIHTSEQSIDRVLNTGVPVVLVFWRKDCAPCAQLNPVLDELARVYADKTLIAKVDASDNPGLIRRYNVTHLPSMRFIQDERVLAQATGAVSEASLRSWLDALLKGNRNVPAPSGQSVPLAGATRPYGGQQSDSTPRPPSANGTIQPIELTDATFDRLIKQNEQPALVDFWAPWCGPCRMLAPAVEQLAREFAGRATVAKLNIDDHPRIAQRYGIQSIPAVYVFRDGQVVDRVIGVQPAGVLRQALERHVG
jgi:thioredoxin 1